MRINVIEYLTPAKRDTMFMSDISLLTFLSDMQEKFIKIFPDGDIRIHTFNTIYEEYYVKEIELCIYKCTKYTDGSIHYFRSTKSKSTRKYYFEISYTEKEKDEDYDPNGIEIIMSPLSICNRLTDEEIKDLYAYELFKQYIDKIN